MSLTFRGGAVDRLARRPSRGYIAFAEKVVPNAEGSFMPEIHDPASAEREAFTQFVARAIEFDKFKR